MVQSVNPERVQLTDTIWGMILYIRMNTFRYTASARLGVWDFVPHKRDEFLDALAKILQDNSHAVLESNQVEFTPTNDPSLASITAICDKIIARGNPTLIDFDFERTLLNGPCEQYLSVEELGEKEEAVGFKFSGMKVPGKRDALLKAAQDLSLLPYRSKTGSTIGIREMPPELRDSTSVEEDLFLDQFKTIFGEYLSTKLHRQVLIRELVDQPDNNLEQSRVDFVFQSGPVRWVFEVDGQQHNEPKQRDLDKQRDTLLEQYGWMVHRVPAGDVREKHTALLEQLKDENAHILNPTEHDSVQTITARSGVHAAAFNSILLPLAVQRCLRGLLLLYLHEVLDTAHQQRILIIEEDCPVVAEAFRILCSIWEKIHILAPDTSPPPKLKLDVIGGNPDLSTADTVRYLDAPDGSYDLILSHSFLLDTGCVGSIEKTHFPIRPKNYVCLRHAIGFRGKRSLQWCESLRYDLADVEQATISRHDDNQEPMPPEKHKALIFFLKHIFRKRDFRDGQLRVIARLLQGKESIVLLPTGGGKSLTYQFSGLLLPGMTIVIDPLVALMADQVENLQTAGIDLVESVSSQQGPEDRKAVLRGMEFGRLAFIFISPERLQSQDFRNRLKTAVGEFPVSLAVIDEAHCVSEWGHDFRPSYLRLPHNLQQYCSGGEDRKPTLVGLTGTASFAVLADIQTEMDVKDEYAIILPQSFDRPEICFDVTKVPTSGKAPALQAVKRRMPRILRSNPQNFYDPKGDRTNSGIVFCPHVNGSLGVTSVAQQLGHRNFFAGQKPKNFDGESQWNEHKKKLQEDFKNNRVQELVATKSFGMGIDKPNIRYTVHYVVPQSVEAFYQEAGRAGRNGKPQYARCYILYSDDNWDSALEILNESDHKVALGLLNSINWNNRGDLLVQLQLLFNSYGGRSEEKKFTFKFWKENLEPLIADMQVVGATNTKDIVFEKDKDRERKEKAIFRLMLLGVVQDYTIDWGSSHFAVTVKRISPSELKNKLRRYLMNYKSADFAENKVSAIPKDTTTNALQKAVDVLIDFIYDVIVAKRKQALRTMGELCRNFTNDQEFRKSILAYLQESKFSDKLREWINRDFNDIGLEAIHGLLGKVTALEDLEEVKLLVGTARRMLDEDPQNLALRYLSMCARAQSETESDSSVLQEATTLVLQIKQNQDRLDDSDSILLSILNDIVDRRPKLLNEVGEIVFRDAGTVELSRLILGSEKLAKIESLRAHAVKLLLASVNRTLEDCTFYTTLREETGNA